MVANEFASWFREVEGFNSTKSVEGTLADVAQSVASQLSPAMKFILPCAPFADGAPSNGPLAIFRIITIPFL